MFEHFKVNSLSSFKCKFFAYSLDPSAAKPSTAPRAQWKKALVESGTEDQFIGQLLGSKRHGQGILLTRGSTAPMVYIGCFQDGLRNGYGAIVTPRGETFHGFFRDDIMWGPGAYTFPTPNASSQSEQKLMRHRVRFDGMFNGQPSGRGVMTWSDGAREFGEYNGYELQQKLDFQGCEGVVMVAQQNAEMAKRVAAEVVQELRRLGLWDEQAEDLLAQGTAAGNSGS